MTRTAVVNHGPGWRTAAGRAAAELLRAAADAVTTAYRSARADDAILVGTAEQVQLVSGTSVAYARHGAHAAVALPVDVLLRALARDVENAARLREIHATRGEGRALVVLGPGGIGVTRIQMADVDLPGPLAQGGES